MHPTRHLPFLTLALLAICAARVAAQPELSVLSSFGAPDSRAPQGIDTDPSGSLWISTAAPSTATDPIFEVTRAGSVLTQFASPGTDAQAIDYDTTSNTLWHVTSPTFAQSTLYNLSTSGSVLNSAPVRTAFGDVQGVTHHNTTGHIWLTNSGGTLFETDLSTTVYNTFNSSPTFRFGAAVDYDPSSGNLWVSGQDLTTGRNVLAELDAAGTFLRTLNVPVSIGGIQDIAVDGAAFWISDITGDFHEVAAIPAPPVLISGLGLFAVLGLRRRTI